MTAQSDPYVRVYYRIIDDPKFEEVFPDDRMLATWLRLLLTADATFPAPAPIPQGVSKVALAYLVGVHLVDLLPASRYRMHGMESERGKRSDQARSAANARYGRSALPHALAVREHSVSSAGAVDTQMHSAPLLSAPLLSEKNPRLNDLLALFMELTGQSYALPPHGKHAENLERWVAKDGWAAVETAARQASEDLGPYPEVGQLVFSIDALLHPPLAPKRLNGKEVEKADAEALTAALRDRANKRIAEGAAS